MKGYLCLGSNLGDRQYNIQSALELLVKAGIRIVKASSVYETKPHDVDGPQENYYNIAAEIECDKTPHEVLDACMKVENLLGRKRPYRHAPRTIDIDILMLDDLRISAPELTVPHPRMEERPFVIYPLAEIAPDIVLPSGRGIIEVRNALPGDEITGMRKLCYG
ncbi:MAG TPA: 2-amino-4-hydroxy-6-hydroxymethyldihydropteridine diphosphokinase [Deltaproteobacteria bacterium]|jgi:2-amino-4-hydroxy-6-hydroxymethyldihydropteridine diphosphokinase|nr:2-amino-4-hydroxy-6-hydroxymethyldihydropteridine diphosphokinase [Deltaproteobacteria bacterium]HQI01899.1 2-amino-4-hydroxy-6-hydroxymethyldihydropteridine diphosphokinase [Deltaproteobacteria bacterium]